MYERPTSASVKTTPVWGPSRTRNDGCDSPGPSRSNRSRTMPRAIDNELSGRASALDGGSDTINAYSPIAIWSPSRSG